MPRGGERGLQVAIGGRPFCLGAVAGSFHTAAAFDTPAVHLQSDADLTPLPRGIDATAFDVDVRRCLPGEIWLNIKAPRLAVFLNYSADVLGF